jgi:hypothetical protein
MNKKRMSIFVVVMMLMSICIPNIPTFAATSNGIEVQTFNANTSASSNTIASNYKIVNTSSSAVNLSDITLRYYYTSDGIQSDQFWCDHAAMVTGSNYETVTSKITSKFGKLSTAVGNADSYLEIGFANNSGQLAAGASITIQTRAAKSDWSNYNQSNDYSFNSTATNYTASTTVTGYVAGTLVSGVEPGATVPVIKDSTISPTSVTVVKGEEVAVPVQMTLNGNTLKDIYNGTTKLVSGTDYTVANNTVTLSASYLAKLSVGTYAFAFNFSAGKAATLNVVIKSAPITSAFTMDLGKVTGKTGDTVTVPLDFTKVPSTGILGTSFSVSYDANLLELVDVTTGAIVKNAGVNFAYGDLPASNKVNIFFCDETYGSELITTSGNFINLNFKIKGTENVVTPINVIDEAVADVDGNAIATTINNGNITITKGVVIPPVVVDSTINPTSITFEKGKALATPVEMTLGGNTLVDISNGTTKLVSGTNYTVANNIVTLSASYLATLPEGVATLTFNFSAGKAASLTVLVTPTVIVVVDSTINPTSITFEDGKAVAVPVQMTLNGNTLKDIYNGTTKLVSGTDYTVVNNTVTLSASYLETLPVGTSKITVNFSAGKAATFSVVVTNSVPVPTEFSMDLGKVSGKTGDSVDVVLNLSNVGTSILGTSFSVGYDSTLLEVVSVTPGAIIANATTNFAYGDLPASNKINMFFCDETYGSHLITKSGNFLTIKFKIKGTTAIETPIKILDDAVADIDGNAIVTVINNGSITITK